MVVKEMSVEHGDDQNDTIHLFLKLPRGLDQTRLIALVGDVDEVRSVTLE